MTVRYELRKVGVYDRETGRTLTPLDNEFHNEYHEWLKDPANVPDPEPVKMDTRNTTGNSP